MRFMLCRLAVWWLRQNGYYVPGRGFAGAVFGGCSVVGHGSEVRVYPHDPGGEIVVLAGASVEVSMGQPLSPTA